MSSKSAITTPMLVVECDPVPIQKNVNPIDITGLEIVPTDKEKEARKFDEKTALIRGMGRGRSAQPISIVLYADKGIATSFNTVYDTVYSLSPYDSSEFTSVSNLYDEVIVDRFVFHVAASFTGTVGGASYNMGLAYDPIHNAKAGSLLNVWQHQQRLTWCSCVSTASGQTETMTPRGYMKWKVSVKQKSARSTDSVQIFGHDWSSTSATLGPVYGYVKPYIPIVGNVGAVSLATIVEMHCRFRCRT